MPAREFEQKGNVVVPAPRQVYFAQPGEEDKVDPFECDPDLLKELEAQGRGESVDASDAAGAAKDVDE